MYFHVSALLVVFKENFEQTMIGIHFSAERKQKNPQLQSTNKFRKEQKTSGKMHEMQTQYLHTTNINCPMAGRDGVWFQSRFVATCDQCVSYFCSPFYIYSVISFGWRAFCLAVRFPHIPLLFLCSPIFNLFLRCKAYDVCCWWILLSNFLLLPTHPA